MLIILSGFVSSSLGSRIPASRSERRKVQFVFGLILAMVLAFC